MTKYHGECIQNGLVPTYNVPRQSIENIAKVIVATTIDLYYCRVPWGIPAMLIKIVEVTVHVTGCNRDRKYFFKCLIDKPTLAKNIEHPR